ncbi:MAG: hypothetical protein GX666_12195 [Tissierellia bacterium]|nr:hypothetical protein [Tissierellia bacterium]
MMNYEEELKKLKSDIDKANSLKNVAAANLKVLEEQEAQLLEDLKQLGVEPENLDSTIEKLKNEIEEMLKEANSLMPRDILDRVNK